jgi:hypothetical protein
MSRKKTGELFVVLLLDGDSEHEFKDSSYVLSMYVIDFTH